MKRTKTMIEVTPCKRGQTTSLALTAPGRCAMRQKKRCLALAQQCYVHLWIVVNGKQNEKQKERKSDQYHLEWMHSEQRQCKQDEPLQQPMVALFWMSGWNHGCTGGLAPMLKLCTCSRDMLTCVAFDWPQRIKSHQAQTTHAASWVARGMIARALGFEIPGFPCAVPVPEKQEHSQQNAIARLWANPSNDKNH